MGGDDTFPKQPNEAYDVLKDPSVDNSTTIHPQGFGPNGFWYGRV